MERDRKEPTGYGKMRSQNCNDMDKNSQGKIGLAKIFLRINLEGEERIQDKDEDGGLLAVEVDREDSEQVEEEVKTLEIAIAWTQRNNDKKTIT